MRRASASARGVNALRVETKEAGLRRMRLRLIPAFKRSFVIPGVQFETPSPLPCAATFLPRPPSCSVAEVSLMMLQWSKQMTGYPPASLNGLAGPRTS